jgi:membrane-bound metal-dependent hydrolase YbcI (DUF457 family)
MIAGHFGLAAAVKSGYRQVPLWALMLATVWLDVLFVPLLLAGIETIGTVQGAEAGYGKAIIHADYTHSLVGALLLAALFGLVAARSWGQRSGTVLGAVVFSHWLLDLIVHLADMPVLPGNFGGFPRLGLGLWQVPAASIVIELVLVLAGSYLYWRSARQTSRGGNPARSSTANLLGGLVLVAGIATLVMDLLGL